MIEKLKFVFGRVENIVGKGQNADCQHFLLFCHNVFKRLVFQSKVVWYRVKMNTIESKIKIFKGDNMYNTEPSLTLQAMDMIVVIHVVF